VYTTSLGYDVLLIARINSGGLDNSGGAAVGVGALVAGIEVAVGTGVAVGSGVKVAEGIAVGVFVDDGSGVEVGVSGVVQADNSIIAASITLMERVRCKRLFIFISSFV
jgi:hypothetical protein